MTDITPQDSISSLSFSLVVPREWTMIDSEDRFKMVETLLTQLRTIYVIDEGSQAIERLTGIVDAIRSTGSVRIYTYASAVPGSILSASLIVSILPILYPNDLTLDDFFLGIMRSLGKSEEGMEIGMSSIEFGWSGEFFRSERVIEEPIDMPWPHTREVRFLIPHVAGNWVALITASTPNINASFVVEAFDVAAKTFRWHPGPDEVGTAPQYA